MTTLEKFNGVIETYYGNGQPKLKATYKDDKLNGLREEWYENGKQWVSAIYKDGVVVE